MTKSPKELLMSCAIHFGLLAIVLFNADKAIEIKPSEAPNAAPIKVAVSKIETTAVSDESVQSIIDEMKATERSQKLKQDRLADKVNMLEREAQQVKAENKQEVKKLEQLRKKVAAEEKRLREVSKEAAGKKLREAELANTKKQELSRAKKLKERKDAQRELEKRQEENRKLLKQIERKNEELKAKQTRRLRHAYEKSIHNVLFNNWITPFHRRDVVCKVQLEVDEKGYIQGFEYLSDCPADYAESIETAISETLYLGAPPSLVYSKFEEVNFVDGKAGINVGG